MGRGTSVLRFRRRSMLARRSGDRCRGGRGLPKIPFRLPELIAAARTTAIAVCAGEKDVLTMAKLGYVGRRN
jgi:hypothetical protein